MDYLFLLYLGDIVGSVSGALKALAVFAFIAIVISQFVLALFHSDCYNDVETIRLRALQIKGVKWTMIPVITLLIATAIPSKTFIYTAVALKAGVEITQEIKENPLVSKGFKVLEKYLDEELTPPTANTSADNMPVGADQG